MTTFVVLIFLVVYLSMFLGGIPGLRVDRTGAALIGAIVLLAGDGIDDKAALQSVDVPTIALIVSAQFQLGGFYAHAIRRVVSTESTPQGLLALVILFAGALSAVLTNDVVCVTVAPLLVQLCLAKELNPVPYLLGLACAANVGSAATLIGNPQNILIGEALELSFNEYFLTALPTCVAGLAVIWGIIALQYRGQWHREGSSNAADPENGYDRWQTIKGFLVLTLLIAGFIFAPQWPREWLALLAAGVLLLNQTFHSRTIMGLVDWHLLVLFISLFIVNRAFELTGGMEWLVAQTSQAGVSLQQPATLFIATAVLSNLISNVPAVMLLLPIAQGDNIGALLALSSTLAGNLIIVGSIANIIVVDASGQAGIPISMRTHARVGIPVTLITLLIAGVQLYLMR
jgi:Na+/H+ antiporter NhaD/arsenite permease-like protein